MERQKYSLLNHHFGWVSDDRNGVVRISYTFPACLASFPGPRRGGERAWFPLFAHALNRGGIPPAPRTFDSCPYPCDVQADTKRYVVCTVTVVSEYGVRFYSTDLDCALSYALQRLGTPNLILKPEQQSVIESICNGKDTFVWLPTGFGLPVDLLSGLPASVAALHC